MSTEFETQKAQFINMINDKFAECAATEKNYVAIREIY